MVFHFITIFPHIFDSYFSESLFKRAVSSGIVKINIVNLRDFSKDKHLKVDDSPFGGGPGMVLKAEPIVLAAGKILKSRPRAKKRVILFSTRGKIFNQKAAKRLSKYDELVFICGRYEGVDERIAKYVADEEISMGDYILSGGELPAMIVAEAVSRQKQGFLGKYESLEEIKGSYPVYTRPVEIKLKKGKKIIKAGVPEVLLSGNHKDIDFWRSIFKKKKTGKA